MSSEITWVQPELVTSHGRPRHWFADDPRFTVEWWSGTADFRPPNHLWRSYLRQGEEVARMLLGLQFESHLDGSSEPALLVWSFEVREDLRCSGIGTAIVHDLVEEFGNQEIYIGSAVDAESFWTRFDWPMCACEMCRGHDFIVRRPV